MNLREWNSGTAETKPYLNPVCNSLNCIGVNCTNVNCITINDSPLPIQVRKYVGLVTKSVSSTGTEGSLIPVTGSGSMTIPINTMSVGDTYKISIGGTMTCVSSENLTLRLRMGPQSSVTVCTIFLQALPLTTLQPFTLDCTFTVRTLGGFGVASCAINMCQIQTLNSVNGSINKSQSEINQLVFQTDDDNDVNVTAQWGSSSANSINSFTVCFYKIF